ncbi:DUF3304 domain-containing protein [Lelliottia wanjuensis]|uniref:DUF3304 domain-containing protein n=1 Tax=Lelliottia wanjuensis TaxID=3050585 RepID=A0AAP4D2Q7_9ENTR|nr:MULTISPECIES: DUF3304 domain-containing protein [unclassified Lelliottia]MDK9362933.1 DUF3304 domain-containing protein [Lelliottia sp. V106_12]MDK9616582.1 DUF3304 domain-containing protein [Lelliottia sp. V106_9]
MRLLRFALLLNSMLMVALLSTGCSPSARSPSSAANISGINHVAGQTVNSFTVNGYGGSLIGNSCCIMLPDKWRPGLKANIQWEVDPQTAGNPPSYSDWDKYLAWEKSLKASFQKHSIVVEIPKYDQACGLTVHFLPCNQVKVTASCYGYGAPEYPVKEPLNMKEPASCPVN